MASALESIPFSDSSASTTTISTGRMPVKTYGASGPCCMLCGSTRTSSGHPNIISPASDASPSVAAERGPTRIAWSARSQRRIGGAVTGRRRAARPVRRRR